MMPWWYYGYGRPWGLPFGGYGYSPWGPMPKEYEISMLEEQERWLTTELDGVRKRLSELKAK